MLTRRFGEKGRDEGMITKEKEGRKEGREGGHAVRASDRVWRKSLSAFYRLSSLLSVGGEVSSSLLSCPLIHLASSCTACPQLERLSECVCVCV